ncbi:unnamed protein product [Lactuca saligna]|uniref:3'-5' exonuclease domain-containing protein n=1 Tax=Lactuca saligna TaxID=75948 RepID=A0AA35Z8A3_LACSI|nr:unnamed protein product [Lactuca saligna]
MSLHGSEVTENISDHRLIIGLDTEWRASFRYTFTSVGIHTDAEMLVRNYGLGHADDRTILVANVMDVVWLAVSMNGNTINGLGLKLLAKMLLSMEPEKPKRVTLSKWGNQWL